MWFSLLTLFSILNYTYGFNAIVVGGGPVGKLSAISLALRGHTVKIYEKDVSNKEIDIDKSYNFIIPERGINSLDAFQIPYEDVSVYVKNIVRHDFKETYSFPSPESISISRNDLIGSIDIVLNELGVPTYNSELIGADLNKNIAVFSHGIERFDLLLGADGGRSLTRSLMLMHDSKNMNICSELDNRVFKTLYITPEQLKSIPGYTKDWYNSFHVWQTSTSDLICPPNIYGGLSASFVSKNGNFDDNRLPPNFDYNRITDQKERVQRTVIPSRIGYESVALLGDAAHTMLSSLGAGVTAGLEDCIVLDKCIRECRTPSEICEMYNKIRIEDSISICNLSKIAFGKSDRSNRAGVIDEKVLISLGDSNVPYHEIERDIRYI